MNGSHCCVSQDYEGCDYRNFEDEAYSHARDLDPNYHLCFPVVCIVVVNPGGPSSPILLLVSCFSPVGCCCLAVPAVIVENGTCQMFDVH